MIIYVPDFSVESGEKLGKYVGSKVYIIHTREFPNSEVLARIEEPTAVKNEEILLYFPTYPNTNDRIILLLQSLESLNNYGAKEIYLCIPYLSYSRQDKRFMEGESLSLKMFLDLLHFYNVSKLICINVHNEESLFKYAKMEVHHLNLFSKLLSQVLSYTLISRDETLLVAPDEGRYKTVHNLAREFNLESIHFRKERDRVTGKIKTTPPLTIPKARYAIIVDDEISTGATIASVASYLANSGIKPFACAIHLLLCENAVERLIKSGVQNIFGTNTVLNPFTIIEVEPYVAQVLKSL
ncbi:MAG: ribose-phosphate diphosphokinase [Candidatus Geothermarchaeota archaeon]